MTTSVEVPALFVFRDRDEQRTGTAQKDAPDRPIVRDNEGLRVKTVEPGAPPATSSFGIPAS